MRKHYEGNLIYLLKSGSEFIRNNSKVRFVKEAQYRVDKPDYAERAVTEALVNALIHRDYIVLGSEVHIDMFDDRVKSHLRAVCLAAAQFRNTIFTVFVRCDETL